MTKEKTLSQIKKDIEEADKEKDNVISTAKKIDDKITNTWNKGMLIGSSVCVILMFISVLERNRPLLLISGLGFIILIIAYATYIMKEVK